VIKPRICIPVCATRIEDLISAIAKAVHATDDTDYIELRLDCLNEEEFGRAMCDSAAVLRRIIAESSRPVVLTLRDYEQSGKRKIHETERVWFWKQTLSLLNAGRFAAENLADIELDLLERFFNENSVADEVLFDLRRVICSHHDFKGVTPDFSSIYERARGTKAHIIKIAAQTGDAVDCLPFIRVLDRAHRDRQEIIVISMGEAGSWLRVLASRRGEFLTYAALDEEYTTAPGQVTAEELDSLYRIHQLDAQTEITGIIGAPVAHSLSPHIHNSAFAARKLNFVYLPFLVRDLTSFLRRMAHPRTGEIKWRLRGLSVTAPHKETIIQHLDYVDETARAIGAVNTVRIEADKLCGYNTDAEAALVPLRNRIELRGARVAVIGAGGAARALLWSLKCEGAGITVFARDIKRARNVSLKFGAHITDLNGARFDNFDLVINATPLGTRGQNENETPAAAQQLQGARSVYDLVYNPEETRFLREARKAGCAIIEQGGLTMLVAQAAEQFKLWTGEDAPLNVMRSAADNRIRRNARL
jgi:3-dehydroquinate dehydratase / shikimate dehydrogenase